MAIPLFEEDMEIISKLGTRPGEDNGLTTVELKGKFDLQGILIKKFLNEVLIPMANMTIDVQALLNGILDTTLTEADKAANAYATGEAIATVKNIATAAVPKSGGEMVGNLSIPAPTESSHAVNKEYVDTKLVTTILFASGWSEGEAPYSQTVTVPGLTDKRTAEIHPVYSGTCDEKRAMQEACCCVSYAESSGTELTFYCLNNKPEVDISVIVEVGV